MFLDAGDKCIVFLWLTTHGERELIQENLRQSSLNDLSPDEALESNLHVE